MNLTSIDKQRHWRLVLLNEIANTGRILSAAKIEMPQLYTKLLRQRAITAQQATRSIAIFRDLEMIKQAEQWNHDRGGHPPTTAKATLALLAVFRQMRH